MVSSSLYSLMRFVIVLPTVFVCLLLASCGEEPPVKIGFLGGITGRIADLGVAGRDAATMAVEERNRAGGVNGRRVELVVKDDQQDAAAARKAVAELIDAKVTAIIGPMTSSMAMAVLPQIEASRTVMVSPTVKTTQLTGKDDCFFRASVSLDRNAQEMAAYVTAKRGISKFAVVYDLANRDFTETWFKAFANALEEKGGEIVFTEAMDTKQETRFLPVARHILESNAQGVLLLSNAIDTALMAQQIRKLGSDLPLFASEWASTIDLLSFGGRAVVGMASYHSFNAESESARYLDFKERFAERFGYQPSFATVLSFDATTYLLEAIEKNPSTQDIKDALIAVDTFAGLQSDFKVDRFGDVERKLFLTVVEDGRFKVVE